MPTHRINVGITYPGAGGPGVNVWHCRTDGLQTADVQNLVDDLETFYSALTQQLPSGTTVSCPNEVITDPYGSPEYTAIEGWSVAGNGPAAMLPPANQVCITWRTTSATRAGRGRTFIGPLTSAVAEANGTINNSSLAIVRAAATALVDASEQGLNGAFGVYSRKQSLLRDFTGSSVRDQFAVLRSRRD